MPHSNARLNQRRERIISCPQSRAAAGSTLLGFCRRVAALQKAAHRVGRVGQAHFSAYFPEQGPDIGGEGGFDDFLGGDQVIRLRALAASAFWSTIKALA